MCICGFKRPQRLPDFVQYVPFRENLDTLNNSKFIIVFSLKNKNNEKFFFIGFRIFVVPYWGVRLTIFDKAVGQKGPFRAHAQRLSENWKQDGSRGPCDGVKVGCDRN